MVLGLRPRADGQQEDESGNDAAWSPCHVASALDEQARESRSRLEKEIVRQLEGVCTTAEGALSSAQAQRARGEAAVASELERLRVVRARVTATLASLDHAT